MKMFQHLQKLGSGKFRNPPGAAAGRQVAGPAGVTCWAKKLAVRAALGFGEVGAIQVQTTGIVILRI